MFNIAYTNVISMKNRLKEILTQKGMSQAHVGRQLNKTRFTINGWCQNNHQPQLCDAYELSKLLNIKLDDLIEK